MKLIAVIISVLCFCSCGTLEQKEKFQEVLKEDASVNRIMYLYFSAKHDSATHKTIIELLEIKIPKGSLKNGFIKQPEMLKGDWLCTFYDGRNNVIEKIEIENPLIIRGEFPDEQGNYESISESRKTIEFFIRSNLNRDVRYLTIDEIMENSKVRLIEKINLPEK